MKKIKIEFQYFEGCPNSNELMKNLKEAILGLENFIEIKYLLVETNEMAKSIGFRGSPTLIINGEDFEGLPIQKEPSLNCRIYKNGIPSAKDIRNKLEFILNKE